MYIKRRWNEHKIKLRKDKHYNQYLQNSWNKYGKESFDFIIIEKINLNNKQKLKEKLIEREQFYLDKINPEYNILPNAYTFFGHSLTEEHKNKIKNELKGKYTGEDHWWYGKNHTEEWKEKMSKKLSGENNPMYGKYGDKNPMYGRKHTKESKRKNTRNNGKLLELEVLQIRKLCNNSDLKQKEIASRFNVSESTISEIKNRKRWKYI